MYSGINVLSKSQMQAMVFWVKRDAAILTPELKPDEAAQASPLLLSAKALA
jgi:hypothetical protein